MEGKRSRLSHKCRGECPSPLWSHKATASNQLVRILHGEKGVFGVILLAILGDPPSWVLSKEVEDLVQVNDLRLKTQASGVEIQVLAAGQPLIPVPHVAHEFRLPK